jgi:hypothetical protein
LSVRNLARLVIGALIVAATLVAAPANAYTYPIISALDTSTTGHLKGTVTTDAPYVVVWVPGNYDHFFATAAGVAHFDLETWGLDSSYVSAWPCGNGTDTSSCTPGPDANFTASDVVPTVTWPSDLKIGPQDSFPVTISDPQGGGILAVLWQNTLYPVTRNGTTELNGIPDGDSAILLQRCASTEFQWCKRFDTPETQTPLSVHRTTVARLSVSAANKYGGYISTRQPNLELLITTFRAVAYPYTFDWHLEQNGVPVPNVGGETTGTLTGEGTAKVSIDAYGVADGAYTVEGTLTVHDPEYGDLTGPLTEGSLTVDRKPASFTGVTQSASRIYPYIGAHGLDDAARFTFNGMYGGKTTELYSASDVLVRHGNLSQSTTTPTTWSGYVTARDNSQMVLPAGSYTVYLVDAAGNRKLAGTIIVDHRKLVARTYTKTVSAAGSMVDTYVGKCSSLRRGVRGWYGSLGYYANTRCGTQTGAASEVHTVNQLKLPTAPYYKSVELYTYGGAAKSRPGSQAIMFYLTPRGYFYDKGTATAPVGSHHGYLSNAESYMWPGHYFVWALATAYNHQYDVKHFTVICHYYVLG